MTKNKMYWQINMAGTVAGWCFIFFGIFNSFNNSIVNVLWWVVFLSWCVGHPLELFVSMPIGDKSGIPRNITILKTIVFGFTWWLPLKHGVIDK